MEKSVVRKIRRQSEQYGVIEVKGSSLKGEKLVESFR